MDEKQMLAYESNVKLLIEATKRADIKWKKQNPTTYYYESKPDATEYVTSIQKLASNEFVLLIYEKESKDVIVDITSANLGSSFFGSMLSSTIKSLFTGIEESISQFSINIFESIVNSIKR